jgi:hypothetical protein
MTTDVNHTRTINVRVLTTSGKYPLEGMQKVPETETLQAILDRAAEALRIVDTARWKVALKDGTEVLSPTATYVQLGLHGEAMLDWGPDAGGGGVL